MNFLFLFFHLFAITQAQELIPGLIPRFYANDPAVDLGYSVEELHQKSKTEDISLFDPLESNIWSPHSTLIEQSSIINFNNLEFLGELPSRIGQVRFSVKNSYGEEYIVVLSKKIHGLLLRKNILNKLGYKTPEMSWAPKIKLNFQSMMDKDLLIGEMKDKLLADEKRWIVRNDELEVEIQDALIITQESKIYNLTLGLMPREIHQGRRVLRSVYIPLALVDSPESINLMSWDAGRVILNNIKLNHSQDLDLSYGTSFDDSKWIARRIAKLSRDDWNEVVDKAFYPQAVAELLKEKIIARRNNLLKILNLQNEFEDILFNSMVSFSNQLINGEIVEEFFEGYVSRYSFGDPESPFSSSELGAFTLTKIQSQLINRGITELNKLFGTKDNKAYENKVKEIIKNQGPFFPIQAVMIPTFHGSFILSRDIVTGSYLGTNHKVQLLDNFGYSLDLGLVRGWEGLPIPVRPSAKGNLVFQRLFSHVKPITSLKKTLKEPYKNLAVPMLVKNLANKIDLLKKGHEQVNIKDYLDIINNLKSAIGVGESFIITDSIVPSLSVELEANLSQMMFLDPVMLKLQAQLLTQKIIVSRFHIHRASDNELQIYQDSANGLKLSLSLRLNSYVPLLGFNARWSKSKALTQLYKIDLDPNKMNEDLLKALRISFLSLNHSALKQVVNPFRIEHELGEKGSTWQFLFFRKNRIRSSHNLKISHAKGGDQVIIKRRYDAMTSGQDYEAFTTETINNLMSLFMKFDLGIMPSGSSNPGYSVFGKARNKIFITEYDQKRFHTSYQRIFNGWSVKTKKMDKFIKKLNNEFGEVIFNPEIYMFTNKILLYQIQLNVQLAHEAVLKLLYLPTGTWQHIGAYYVQGFQDQESLNSWINYKKEKSKVILQDFSNKDYDKGLLRFHRFLDELIKRITIKQLETIVGKENIAYQAKVDGFREGDEAGDTPILGDVWGELPIGLHLSPSQKMIQKIGILEGELLLNWASERAM